jgi:hypothetical protein
VTEPVENAIQTEEVVIGLPVLAQTREIQHAEPQLPTRQAAVVAVSGAAVGAMGMALVQRRKAKVLARRGKRRKGIVGEIVGSNSFLVDVHLLKRP